MEKLFECRSCSSRDLELVIGFKPIPLVGEFTTHPNPLAEKFPINLFFCLNCQVLLIEESIDSEKLFNSYSFSSSTIPNLVAHFDELASWIVKRLSPKSVLEIGCNDGILLNPLERLGVKAFGVDISQNITEIARQKGLKVKKLKFGLETKELIQEWQSSFDVITASNTFPHNSNPNSFLGAANQLLSHEGNLILEVMYAGRLRDYLQWDTVYHEHLHFHSLLSLEKLLNRNNFYVSHAEIVPMHAGSLRVVASKIKRQKSNQYLDIMKYEETSKLNELNTWLEFGKACNVSIQRIKEGLNLYAKQGEVWAYGASGRASMWINVANLDYIKKVVDGSPLRANHFMPGSDIPIVLPEEFEKNPPRAIFVTAWNYFDDIIKRHPKFQGTWITPLPEYRELSNTKKEFNAQP